MVGFLARVLQARMEMALALNGWIRDHRNPTYQVLLWGGCQKLKICSAAQEFYTFLETTLMTASLLPHLIAFFSDREILGTPGSLATTFLAFVLNLAFAPSVLGFLIMHISLVAANTTAIEAYEKKTTPKWRYDLGR